MNPSNERRKQAVNWALNELAWPQCEQASISSDASFRNYYRLMRDSASFVVMDAPPDVERTQEFVDIADRLRAVGLHAPEVLAHDPEQGFVLLEDLGPRPFHHVLDSGNADSLFDDAVEALIHMQTEVDVSGLPSYDPALLMRELNLFVDWFLARHWQVEPTDGELDGWDEICATLLRWALDQPQVFCHRDYMPRNLLIAEPNPGIIDFQDAVIGPISYDPVCLFRDAFLSWPVEQSDRWLEDYRQRAAAAGLPVPASAQLWQRSCDLVGAHRFLKVIGIFARIRYRDGKPRYLRDVPRFFRYLEVSIRRNPELDELDGLLDAWRQRRVQ